MKICVNLTQYDIDKMHHLAIANPSDGITINGEISGPDFTQTGETIPVEVKIKLTSDRRSSINENS